MSNVHMARIIRFLTNQLPYGHFLRPQIILFFRVQKWEVIKEGSVDPGRQAPYPPLGNLQHTKGKR